LFVFPKPEAPMIGADGIVAFAQQFDRVIKRASARISTSADLSTRIPLSLPFNLSMKRIYLKRSSTGTPRAIFRLWKWSVMPRYS
jgi:hypothetical protein